MRLAIGALFLAVLSCHTAPAQVVLRDGKNKVEAPVAGVGLEGVRITVDVDGKKQEQIVGWDRVKRLEGEHAGEAEALAELADHAWRARQRLERADFGSAEPLFEQVFSTLAGHDGPTAALAAEGLLRCRLAREAQAGSVWPWLEWLGVMARSGGLPGQNPPIAKLVTGARSRWIGGKVQLDPVIDEATGIVSALPPVWLNGPGVAALASAAEWTKYKAGDGMAADMAALYEQAARFEAGLEAKMPGILQDEKGNAGLSLVRDMVASRIGGPDERKAARDALQARMAPPPQTAGKAKPVPVPRWLEAWCRIGIGRSLLRESDESSRMQGVIQLLHLPARFGTQEPYLCEVALAEASVALNELGDAAGASALKYELKERLPRSAALQWEPLKKVKDQGPGNKTRPESGASMTAAPRTMTRQYKDRS